jgi:transcriptional repressor NrdR
VKCPFCGFTDSKVTDSRTVDAAIRRRRECLRCNARFTTYERVQQAGVLLVKKDGRREEFSREKVLAGVRKACEKLPLEATAVEATVDAVETAVLGIGLSEVESARIGELVMSALRELDQIAYVRFASVYRSFTDIDSLREAIDELERSSPLGRRPREQLPLMPETELDQLIQPPRILPLRPAAGRPPDRHRRA